MKKILSLSIACSVFFAGWLFAIPHTHKDDWNHANHQTCPIYQASLQEWSAAAAPVSFSSTLALLQTLLPWCPQSFDCEPSSLPLIRGPPALI